MLAYGVGSVIIIFAIAILAIAIGWELPYLYLTQGLAWLSDNIWEGIAFSIFLLAIGLLFIVRQPQAKVMIRSLSKYGEISVTEDALKEIITRSSLTFTGVHKVQIKIKPRKDGLEIIIASQFMPDELIPQTCEEIQIKVKEDVEHYTGIHVAEVKVLVCSVKPTAHPARVR